MTPRAKDRPYPLNQSPLYKLSTKNKLADLLHLTPKQLVAVVRNTASLYRLDNIDGRQIEDPKHQLKGIHTRLQKLLSRIKTPDYLHSGVKGLSYISNAMAHVGCVL